jgi:antirestriction protein ArdC
MSNAIYETVTKSIIEQLENGVAPWVKPWSADSSANQNLVSKKAYSGINRLILGMSGMAKGYTNNNWATFKQISEAGGMVRKGEKATQIVFFKPVTKTEINSAGDLESTGYAVIKSYAVFNADQTDGLELPATQATIGNFQDVQAAENRIIKTGAAITHGGDSAFFMHSADRVQLPNKTAFLTESNYYATAFHELTHWSGAKHRLDRDLSKGKFGNPEYAFEELVAEIGAAFLCQDHGIDGDIRHVAYIKSWLSVLKHDNSAIFKAAALAQKAADYINSLDATAQSVAA